MWHWTGDERPPFAATPGPGQESVWDYPRPPRLALDAREVVIGGDGIEIARTRRALRVLETASPPTFYLPLADLKAGLLQSASGRSFCEWKGAAVYWSVVLPGLTLARLAWSCPEPTPTFAALRDRVRFLSGATGPPHRRATRAPAARPFYAGWITDEVIGPFKGDPGSERW